MIGYFGLSLIEGLHVLEEKAEINKLEVKKLKSFPPGFTSDFVPGSDYQLERSRLLHLLFPRTIV
jgi:hypothetical protein